MPLGTEVSLGPDDIMLDGAQLPLQKAHAPNFRSMSIVAKRLPISGTAGLLFKIQDGDEQYLKISKTEYLSNDLRYFTNCVRDM